jgi:hypothetical protein
MPEPSNLLQVNPDVIQRLVDLARQIDSREFTGIPEDPEVQAGSADVMALTEQEFDSTTDEFRSIINDLDPEQQQQVVALFRLGGATMPTRNGKTLWARPGRTGT